MIHVGGEYIDQNGQSHVTGSFGCFGVFNEEGQGGNADITILNDDINNRQKAQIIYKKDNKGHILKDAKGKPAVEKNYGTGINVVIKKRKEFHHFKVDKNARIGK